MQALNKAAAMVNPPTRVGIIGGGTAGSTIALRLATLGVQTYLFEQKPSLISGPPMCHLHAGGNLYREIPDEDCIALLEQCVDILRLYPYTIDVRPTVFAVPTRDNGSPQELLPRLKKLQQAYASLVATDPNNEVLGNPNEYYKLYQRDELEALKKLPQVAVPKTMDEWLIPAAQYLDLDKIKYPVIAVQEYGWNIFRLAASATVALEQNDCAHIFTNTTVAQVTPIYGNESAGIGQSTINQLTNSSSITGWQIDYHANDKQANADTIKAKQIEVDYLINACGFKTGIIDDMAGITVKRMVEFKASYISHWDEPKGQIPEIIIYGERGTPNGMAQLTPYPDGYFQIHGMSKSVTLFDDGLVKSSQVSAQPKLPGKYASYIDNGWNETELQDRNQRAIDYISEFIPKFDSARTVGNALYGGQQIPGEDDTLRVADVSLYDDKRYARAENVKASSALQAADEIVAALAKLELLNIDSKQESKRQQHDWQYLCTTSNQQIDKVATQLAAQRSFPLPMARVNHPITTCVNA